MGVIMQQYTKGDAAKQDKPKALVACEYSGSVRDVLAAKGFYAVSCDILPTEANGIHYQGDVMDILDDGWDLLIGHPPCTYLAVSGARWLYHTEDKELPKEDRRRHPKYPNRLQDQKAALDFFMSLYNADIKFVALENPVSMLSSMFRKPNQVVQPYWFGDDAEKKTCFWTKGLPNLEKTDIVKPTRVTTPSGKSYSKWWWDTCLLPTKGGIRAHARNKTFSGIAKAIGDQWGEYVLSQ
jgi:site-specific DNA-cytosine methylase